ncbi:uncharacterized protein C8Q71DRAFT_686284, partial [Rhodofomes roseus]
MWLRKYLQIGEDRPTWAYIVDVIMAINVTRDAGKIRRDAQLNTYLQSWGPATKGKTRLPKYLQTMMATGKKYNVSFAAIKLDRRLKEELPVWYHLGATKQLRRLNNTKVSDCLRQKHGVHVIANLLKVTETHIPIINGQMGSEAQIENECECDKCEDLRNKGCKHPETCRQAAARILGLIRPKWHPENENNDGLSLTHRRKEKNQQAVENEEATTFDPSVTSRDGIAQAFRAFVNPTTHDKPPAIRRGRARNVPEEETTAY